MSTLNRIEQWRGTEYVPHGICVSSDSYVVGITSVIERKLAHACRAQVVSPWFEKASSALLLLFVGEWALPKRHEAFVFL
jgi:hypothetical protein